MMMRRLTLLAPLLVLGAIGLPARAAAPDAATRKQLQPIYDQYIQAFKAKDTGALRQWFERYLSPDMVNQNEDGSRQTRQQLLDDAKAPSPNWKPWAEASGKIEQLTVKGKKATA